MSSRRIVSFDWAIKNIIRDKANYDILEGFLHALLKETITIIELIESESNPDNQEMKYNRVDVLAKNSRGEHIIIEVQYAPETCYFKRLLYGTSKDIVDNISIGEDYSTVKKVYSISLVYFDVEKHKKGTEVSDYVYCGKVEFTGFHNGKKVKINPTYLSGYDNAAKDDINIFPEYYIIPIKVFNDVIHDDLDEWIYAFKNHEVKDDFKAPGIKAMSEKLDFVSMSPEEQREYTKYLADLASTRGVLDFNAREAEKKGIKKGIKEGIKEGIEKGRKEERAKQEQIRKDELRAEQIKTATIAKKEGVPVEVISKMTELSIDEIEKL